MVREILDKAAKEVDIGLSGDLELQVSKHQLLKCSYDNHTDIRFGGDDQDVSIT